MSKAYTDTCMYLIYYRGLGKQGYQCQGMYMIFMVLFSSLLLSVLIVMWIYISHALFTHVWHADMEDAAFILYTFYFWINPFWSDV
jgi:hypothetical protein